MALRDAVGHCRTLTVLEPRPALVTHYADALVETLAAVSPLVEEAEQGLVFADLRGIEGLYPRLGDLKRAVFAGVPERLPAQLGVSEARFTAQVAALRAATCEVLCVALVDAPAFLAAEPVALLPLEREAVERMHMLGIDTCGAFAALPRSALEAQFGFPSGVAWLAVRGEDPVPVRPRPWERERVVEHVQAEPPFISRESVLYAIEHMLARALRHPRARHRFVRQLQLRAETERGALWECTQVLREPLGDRGRLWTLLRSLVEYSDFPGPFTFISLELSGLTEESRRQRSLFVEQTRRREQLDEMVRHLKVRFGASPVIRVVGIEPWHRLPEHRRALLEYDP